MTRRVGGVVKLYCNMSKRSIHLDSGNYVPFHSTRLYDLLKKPQEEYTVPAFPFKLPVYDDKHIQFGAAIKEKHFLLDSKWTYINHGAYGVAMKEGIQVEQAWQVHCEQQPLRYFDRELLSHMAYALRRLAKFVDSDPEDVVFVPNTTTGTCTAIQGLIKTFQPGDSILILSTTFTTVKFLLDKVSKEHNILVDEVPVKFPVNSPDEIVDIVKESLRPNTKLAIFDHVCSLHGITLPVKELVNVCHERGVSVLIDGAHCLGSLPISMREIGADFYVSSAHKWMCASKGCAFLYVSKKYQPVIRPLISSWGYGNGFNAEFGFLGTRDYTPYLSLVTVLDFWESSGPDKIRSYLYKTAGDAGKFLKETWGTSLLADPSMFRTMVLVELPDDVLPSDSGVRAEPPYDDKSAEVLQDIFHYNYKIEAAVKCIDGKLYVRISAHVYNEMKDYERLAEAVLEQKELNQPLLTLA